MLGDGDINFIVIFISQYTHILNHHAEHKLIHSMSQLHPNKARKDYTYKF